MVVVEDGTARQQMLAELGRYARDYRVESAKGGDEAVARLGALRVRGDAVAMVCRPSPVSVRWSRRADSRPQRGADRQAHIAA